MEIIRSLPRWCWWIKGECVVEVIRAGHFPTTVTVRDPMDRVFEVDVHELKQS